MITNYLRNGKDPRIGTKGGPGGNFGGRLNKNKNNKNQS